MTENQIIEPKFSVEWIDMHKIRENNKQTSNLDTTSNQKFIQFNEPNTSIKNQHSIQFEDIESNSDNDNEIIQELEQNIKVDTNTNINTNTNTNINTNSNSNANTNKLNLEVKNSNYVKWGILGVLLLGIFNK